MRRSRAARRSGHLQRRGLIEKIENDPGLK